MTEGLGGSLGEGGAMGSPVHTEVRGGVLLIVLNRPAGSGQYKAPDQP